MKFNFLAFTILFALLTVSCSEEEGKEGKKDSEKMNTNEKNEKTGRPEADNSPGPRVKISTNKGDITLELFNDTPKHRDNFLKLAKEGFYDGTTFHRVMKNFMIQGGDPNSKPGGEESMIGQGGPGYTIPQEILPHRIHTRGALAAARQPDQVNPKKESSGSQFYIVEGFAPNALSADMILQAESQARSKMNGFRYTDQQRKQYNEEGGYPFLDMDYTVFGKVVEGMDVVEKIASVEVSKGNNRPIEPVVMKEVTVIKE